jgi:hypothetical protein
MNTPDPVRIDRRLAIKWMLAAGAGAVLARGRAFGAAGPDAARAEGYGPDPSLTKAYKPGDYWPLTFTDEQRREAAVLADIVLPQDGQYPSASALGVVDFLDEWVSAPYPDNVGDRKVVLDGMAWVQEESVRRFAKPFSGAAQADRLALCEEMARGAQGQPDTGSAHAFFRLFRDLVATGYYTTPVGMKDLGYVGNLPLARFDGPPAELVAKLGLTDEVKW